MDIKTPWNKGLTKESSLSVKKISDTFKKFKIDNFKSWRNNARMKGIIPDTTKALIKNSDLAFLIGITLGDGNINQNRRTQCLRITLGTDKPKLWKYTAKIVENVFNKKPSVIKRKSSNAMNITLYQNNLSKRLSIPIGARKDKIISIPNWIIKNKDYYLQVIRGLFEAEASFSVHKKTYTYNLSFRNKNLSILDFVEKSINKLGFHPERRIDAVRIRRKVEVYQFIDLISFRKYPLI